ncbi:SDR family NAD(P)-dependent oxidoreductase [archaeon]|nr:MAG: SDR family NAD(P)-dependent oxidoreductase [archaeon]
MWKKALLVVAAVPVLIGIFLQYASNQCKSFKIDFSATSGKKVIITGANSGLGLHTAMALARNNATVVLACRNQKRCISAQLKIQTMYPAAQVEAMELDLSSFRSIKNFAKEYKKKYQTVDVLVNNAGIMALPTKELTQDGLEAQMGTNHFGHFLLTALLYPVLSQNGRIINHSSGAHNIASPQFPFENLNSEVSYSPYTAYGNSKMANLLFTYELNKRIRQSGNPKNIVSIAVHPGYTSTNLQTEKFPFWEAANKYFAMSAQDGALAQIYGELFV